MVGYIEIMRSLEDANDLDLQGTKLKALVPKLRYNLFGQFFLSLRDFLVTQSAEAIELRHTKGRSRTPSPKKRQKKSESDKLGDLALPEGPALASSVMVEPFGSPSTSDSKKRVFSNESYEGISTETSPARINHPEPRTQALQNELIKCLVRHIWNGGASVSWAQNREMTLEYRPYRPNK
jgi:hypothetical protein